MGHHEANVVSGVARSLHATYAQVAKREGLKISHGVFRQKAWNSISFERAADNLDLIRSLCEPFLIASNMVFMLVCRQNVGEARAFVSLFKLLHNFERFLKLSSVHCNELLCLGLH